MIQVEGVLYVPYTPNGELRRTLQKTEDNLLKNSRVGRVRVIERLGGKLCDQLCNPTPWKNQHCGRQNCFPCRTKEGSCKQTNITYKWTCLTCLSDRGDRSVYLGESSRSLWDRTVEHLEDLKRRNSNSVLYRHWQECHRDEREPEFSVKVMGSHRSSTERQIWEALEIEKGDYDHLINNKSEWGMNCLVRHGTLDRETEMSKREDRQGDSERQSDSPDAHQETVITPEISFFNSQFKQRKRAAKAAQSQEQSDRVNSVGKRDRDRRGQTVSDYPPMPNSVENVEGPNKKKSRLK